MNRRMLLRAVCSSIGAAALTPISNVAAAQSLCAVPDPKNVASVEVKARPEAVRKPTVWNDCGLSSDDQFLEARVPSFQPPERRADIPPKTREPDGGYPRRRKFCGEARRYGIYDENNDPRDIMIDVYPAAGFEHFVGGFVNTEMTPLTGTEQKKFADGPTDLLLSLPPRCNVSQCLAAAKARPNKTVHCELTPAQQFYGQDGRFMPIAGGEGFCSGSSSRWECHSELEPRGQPEKPSATTKWPQGKDICVYGVYALDHGGYHGGPGSSGAHTTPCCSKDIGHDRPEIHPFDAIWWRHPDPGRDGWIFGVFQDDSNRYSNPDCGGSNDNQWSQAPRDVTFRFPFSFARSAVPKVACIRHLRTRKLKIETVSTSFGSQTIFKNVLGAPHTIAPLNVTTAAQPDRLEESKQLVDGRVTLVTVVEARDTETQVKVDGCVSGGNVSGWITLRVAIGCDSHLSPGCSEARLKSLNPGGNVDAEDAGSGFYYAELTFENGSTCQP
jgi:hypothetical protein